MVDIRELMHEAAETTRPLRTEDVTRTVSRRMARARIARVGLVGVIVLAVVAGGAGGFLYAQDGDGPPAKVAPAVGIVPLPAGHAVGAGARLEARCTTGDKKCVPLLTTTDGRRYTLPGPVTGDVHLRGVALSPSGHWLLYNRAGEVEARDLLGTTTRRVKGSMNQGAPLAWSANDHWVLIRPIRSTGSNETEVDTEGVIRLDLTTGRSFHFSLPDILGHTADQGNGWVKQFGILPNGQIAYPMAGHAPTTKPTKNAAAVLGDGTYRIFDPASGKIVRDLPVGNSVTWDVMGTSQGSEPVRETWEGQGPAPLVATPDGSQAVIMNEIGAGERQPMVGLVDLATGDQHTVDVSKLLAGVAPPGTAYWGVTAFNTKGITVWGQDERGAPLVMVTLSADASRVVSTKRVDALAKGGLLPGWLPLS